MGVEASRKALRCLGKGLLFEKSFEGSLPKRLARIKNPETSSRILLNYFCLSSQPVTDVVVTPLSVIVTVSVVTLLSVTASVVTSRRELST